MLWLSPSGSLYVNASGAPFDATADELTACCCCKWYKIRLAYYDPDCTAVNDGYNDLTSCECRCLIAGDIPDPIPSGKTAADYVAFYTSSPGEYQYTLFGPYDDATACNAAHVEGCDYAWGCSWDTTNNLPRYWYKVNEKIWYGSSVPASCGPPSTQIADINSVFCASTAELNLVECQCSDMTPQCHARILIDGPDNRECDIPQP